MGEHVTEGAGERMRIEIVGPLDRRAAERLSLEIRALAKRHRIPLSAINVSMANGVLPEEELPDSS